MIDRRTSTDPSHPTQKTAVRQVVRRSLPASPLPYRDRCPSTASCKLWFQDLSMYGTLFMPDTPRSNSSSVAAELCSRDCLISS